MFIFPPIWQFQGGSHSLSPGISTHRWNVLLPWKQVSNQHKYNSTMEKANFPPPKKNILKIIYLRNNERFTELLHSFLQLSTVFWRDTPASNSCHVWWTSSPRFSAIFWRHTRNTRVCSTPPGVAGSLRREFSCRGWTFEQVDFHGRCPANTETSIESRWGYPSLRHRSIQDQRCWWQLKKGSSPVIFLFVVYITFPFAAELLCDP